LIDGGGKLLRCKEALRLNGAGLAIIAPRIAFCHVEDDGVCVKLRCNVTMERAGYVVLEFGGDELGPYIIRQNAGIAADKRL